MNTDKLKNAFKQIAFVRDYSSLILPLAVTILAIIILLLTPVLLGGKLQEQINQKSISMARRVESLSKDPVSAEQWKIEKKYQLEHQNDANEIKKLVEQTTQRELLSYKIFPEPQERSSFIFEKFGQNYCSALEKLLDKINAAGCPTETELKQHLPGFSTSSKSDPEKKSDEETKMIKDAVCKRRAESSLVYATPAVLSGYSSWKDYQYPSIEQAVEDCWFSQLAYWIIEDVINTIGKLNGNYNNVIGAPVKRVLAVKFSGKNGDSSGDSIRIPEDDRPKYVYDDDDMLTKENKSLTARVTPRTDFQDVQFQLDVVHFNVIILIDARFVLPFIQELCSEKEHTFSGYPIGRELQNKQKYKHNQITVLESSLQSIKPQENGAYDNYRYGEDPIVELNLICEYVFVKKAYEKIKPPSVGTMTQR